jgi:uncharacterized protein (TIGR03032 family)
MNQSPPVLLVVSPHFSQWLNDERISLALTTYQTNRLFLLGLKPDGSLSAFERLFDRPMGLHATAERLYMSSRYQLWRLDNGLPAGTEHEGYDRLYVPRVAHTTGALDVHDIGLIPSAGGWTPVFVNTLYSCLATLSENYSFKAIWQPSFITRLAPEDRCHLNGLAVVDGKPRYVTAVSSSDVAAGWRERRQEGGCLIDVQTDELVLTDLSMPHSPRVYRDRVWLLNSGTGELGYADLEQGRFEPIAFCPGYLRGLAFYGQYAIVGLSKPRENRTFSDLALDERLQVDGVEARCGLVVVDLETGEIAHWLEFEGVVAELYDVQILPGVVRPMALGFRTDEICRVLTVEDDAELSFEPLVAADGSSEQPIDFMVLQDATQQPGAHHQPSEQVRGITPAGRTIADVPTIDDTGYRFQLSIDMSVAAAQQDFAQLTFPDLVARAQSRFIREPLIATVVLYRGQIVGMAMAEVSEAGKSAEVISLYLAPEHRGRRLSYGLLNHLLKALQERACGSVRLMYQADWPSVQPLERLLTGSGWEAPQPCQAPDREGQAELRMAHRRL